MSDLRLVSHGIFVTVMERSRELFGASSLSHTLRMSYERERERGEPSSICKERARIPGIGLFSHTTQKPSSERKEKFLFYFFIRSSILLRVRNFSHCNKRGGKEKKSVFFFLYWKKSHGRPVLPCVKKKKEDGRRWEMGSGKLSGNAERERERALGRGSDCVRREKKEKETFLFSVLTSSQRP